MEWRNAKHNAHGTIDLEINHPIYGWLPFTATPDDPEHHGRDLYAAALASGEVAAYVPPSDEEARAAMPPLTRKQLRLGMRDLGITSVMIEAAIAAIADDDQREIAQIEWEDSDSYQRTHPLMLSLAAAFGITDAQLDAAWMTASNYS